MDRNNLVVRHACKRHSRVQVEQLGAILHQETLPWRFVFDIPREFLHYWHLKRRLQRRCEKCFLFRAKQAGMKWLVLGLWIGQMAAGGGTTLTG